ncbi:hypothetical protein D9M71_598700 [compost metagenome]
MLQHVAQHHGLGRQPQRTGERRLDHVRVVTFVGRVDTGHQMPAPAQQLQEVTLAAAHLDQAFAGEVPGDQPFDFIQVALEGRREGLLVLVVAVIAQQGLVEGLVVHKTGAFILNQAHVAAGRGARAGGIGEGAVLQHG